MIETGCFEDINAFETDGTVSPDRERSPKPKRGFFHRLFSGEVRVFLFFDKITSETLTSIHLQHLKKNVIGKTGFP